MKNPFRSTRTVTPAGADAHAGTSATPSPGHRRRLAGALIALAAFTAGPAAAARYQIWYHDDNLNYQYGEIEDLQPPGYACGIKFPDPSYYRWGGEYHNTLASADFDKDVRVWLPIPGCPHPNTVVVEYADGSESFEPVLGTHWLEITANHGHRWFDEDGNTYSCGAWCQGPDWFQVEQSDWGLAELALVNLKRASGSDTAAIDVLNRDADVALSKLRKSVAAVVAQRERGSLGDRRVNVGTLERRATQALDDASATLVACQTALASGRQVAKAYRSCDTALVGIVTAREAWDKVAHESR